MDSGSNKALYVSAKFICDMLFVGAGASKPFGAPLLLELTTEVDHIIESYGYKDLWRHIYESLRKSRYGSDGYFASDDEIDMEVVLSVIDLIIDPLRKAEELGPSLYYLSKNLSEDYKGPKPSLQQYSQIRNEIEDKIVDMCKNINFETAIDYYRRLFELEKNVHIRYLNAQGRCPKIIPFRYTVTTNYDLLLERYSLACDLDNSLPIKKFLRRGFTREYDEVELCLQLGNMDEKIEYLKLHGSIDWWLRERDMAVTARESNISLFGESYPNRIMTYPAYDKIVTREPFASLHNYFGEILRSDDVYVIIGYSFKDRAINDSILDALRDENKRMVIVNPTINKIRRKISIFPQDRIDVVLRPFGHAELFNDLETILTGMPQGIA